jgi:exopolyphosphatase/guanosine-5'-triphosphate,3'-diphosphate pyrophosphatase
MLRFEVGRRAFCGVRETGGKTMSEAPRAPDASMAPSGESGRRRRSPGEQSCYAALDLGTNNCRLLVATPSPRGFRVVEAYSRIVRLGEGLSQTGQLSEAAMDRSMAALKVCAEKIRRRGCEDQGRRHPGLPGPTTVRVRPRVAEETGLRCRSSRRKEEAQLSVAGCMSLFDRDADGALVVDVGGGSTELSWVDLKGGGLDASPGSSPPGNCRSRPGCRSRSASSPWPSAFPKASGWRRGGSGPWSTTVKARIAAFPHAEPMREMFEQGRAHLVGTSGAITSLAGLHLGLPRYDRNIVDGLWMHRSECEARPIAC